MIELSLWDTAGASYPINNEQSHLSHGWFQVKKSLIGYGP